ncbi:MAG: hypothetical protein KA187_00680 [Arenimonas sp.]|nr:hypothetical protein [Arenimonas sp.]
MRQPPSPPRRRTLVLALAAVLAAGAALAESGTVLKDTQLRSEPLASSKIIAELRARDTVQINARKGAWAGVKTTEGVDGWARILNLRTGSGQAGAGGGDALASVFRTGSSGTTVSTGVKGLSAAALMSAAADEAEVQRLETYAANTGQATAFAAAGPLASRPVPYLPEERSNRWGSR